MTNDLINAISCAINIEFRDDYEIYADPVEQNLKKPCFLINTLQRERGRFLGKRYYERHMFCIQYFTNNNKRESNDVSERLFKCLEYIIIDKDMIPGTKMREEDQDGILNFFVNYDVFSYIVKESHNMEELQQTVEKKERLLWQQKKGL